MYQEYIVHLRLMHKSAMSSGGGHGVVQVMNTQIVCIHIWYLLGIPSLSHSLSNSLSKFSITFFSAHYSGAQTNYYMYNTVVYIHSITLHTVELGSIVYTSVTAFSNEELTTLHTTDSVIFKTSKHKLYSTAWGPDGSIHPLTIIAICDAVQTFSSSL